MENLYTEADLKKLTITELFKIATKNEIIFPNNTLKPKMIEMILEKGCRMLDDPPENDGAEKFTKEQIMNLHWYSHKRGALSDLLEDGKKYSIKDIERLLNKPPD